MCRARCPVLALLPLALAACEADLHDGIGPRVPVPNVTGRVTRSGEPADDLAVELRSLPGSIGIADTETDAQGAFELVEIAPGDYEVKVSGDEPGDFDSITRSLRVVADLPTVLPEMDIFAHGARNREPADGARLDRPSPFQPLAFRWDLPDGALEWARVQLYDGEGTRVWTSVEEIAEEALWNGLGSEGGYEGVRVPPGTYAWRVRFELPGDVEARSEFRELIFE
jgi:hypothetical protein